MIRAVLLDSGPLGLLAYRGAKVTDADKCKLWADDMTARGVELCVPEIADYEVRRELLRAGKTRSVRRLDTLKATSRYLPITTDVMLLAAELWAESRRRGLPTADPKELDADVILAAQALTLGLPPDDVVVATTNPGHLSRFVTAELWQHIRP